MKTIPLVVACLLPLTGVFAVDSCYENINRECSSSPNTLYLSSCNASYGEYSFRELKAYANLHLVRSYEYLLSASYFNNYKINRAGISKLFRKLSDDAWEKTIGLIKYVSMRGDKMDFLERGRYGKEVSKTYIVEIHELGALAKALDTQKELSERAVSIHHDAITTHDPEVARYLEKEYFEDNAKTIRNLAGYINDLKSFIAGKSHDISLAMYIFDEYLQKAI